MKRIAMFAMCIAAMCMVSCGGSTKSETVDADSVSVETADSTNIVSDLDEVTTALESGNSEAVEAGVQKLQAATPKRLRLMPYSSRNGTTKTRRKWKKWQRTAQPLASLLMR